MNRRPQPEVACPGQWIVRVGAGHGTFLGVGLIAPPAPVPVQFLFGGFRVEYGYRCYGGRCKGGRGPGSAGLCPLGTGMAPVGGAVKGPRLATGRRVRKTAERRLPVWAGACGSLRLDRVGGSNSDGMPQRSRTFGSVYRRPVRVSRTGRGRGGQAPASRDVLPSLVSLPVDRAPAEMPICTVTQLPACRTCIGTTRLLPCIRRHGPGVLSTGRLRGFEQHSLRRSPGMAHSFRAVVGGRRRQGGWVGGCVFGGGLPLT